MSWYDPSSWDDPFVDLYDKGKSVVDAAQDVAKDAVGVAEILGEGIVDAAETIGDGLVTAGEGVAKWSVTATGDAIDWSKTSFAEVAEWSESAAGAVASFTVEAYEAARDGIAAGAIWLYEQIAKYLSETLPTLGGLDPQARDVAGHLLSDPVARGIESLAAAAGCVITFGIKLKALSSLSVGIYACGEGWGFFVDSGYSDLQAMLDSPSLSVGVSAQVTMVFGPVSRASGAQVFKLGLGMKANPANKLGASIGGVVLMEASMPPLFLGLRYAMDLDLDLFGRRTVDDAGQLRWKVKVQAPRPNGDFVTDALGVTGDVAEIGWEELTNGLSSQATHFDAALRAHADPANAERIQATALAVSMSPFKPRYHGAVRTASGAAVVGTGAGALGLDIPGDRRIVQIVAGLTDPTGVSFEAVGEPPLYWCADAGGELKLVPYDQSLDLSGTTFRMIRGLAGQGVSLAVAADGTDNPRFLVATRVRGGVVTPAPVLCAERMNGIEAPTQQDATFLIDRPEPQPEARGSILRPGQFLRVGEAKRAPNGMFSLLLADTGRLVMRRRGSAPLGSPASWIAYEPGVIQDEALLWKWASPAPAAAPAYHAIVTEDGRIAVRAGADPTQAGATLWQSEVHGAPGPCFLAITNQGAATLVRGTPDAPGEVVWSSLAGAIYWPTRRRQVVLHVDGGFVTAHEGGGTHTPEALTQPPARPVWIRDGAVGGWQMFELQELCTGHVALRAQGRRFVGVDPDSRAVSCLNHQVGARELFTLEVLSEHGELSRLVRLKSAAADAYVGVTSLATVPGFPDLLNIKLLTANHVADVAPPISMTEVEHDFFAHSGRAVHVVAKHSGQALEVEAGRSDDGRWVVQGELHGMEHQKWVLTHVGDGWFSLVNRHTGKALDVYEGSTIQGAYAMQQAPHAGDSQRFALTPSGDGHYFITVKHSGQVVDVVGASQQRGGRVRQWPRDGADRQQWKVTLAPPESRSRWTPLGGGLASEPAVTSAGPGRLDVFARGPDDAMWQTGANGGWRSWWDSHGGGFVGEPVVVAQSESRIDVLGRGKDNAIWQRWWAGGDAWHGWAYLGGQTLAAPVALAPRPGRWDIFVLGMDGAIWHRYAEDHWSPWVSLGGGLLDPPAVVWRDGRYDLFARGIDKSLYQNTWQDGAWSGWVHHGGQYLGRPTAVSSAPGCFDVFGRGSDGSLWQRSLRAGTGTWVGLQGELSADPAAISIAADRVDVFGRGSDGALWHRRRIAADWLPWRRLGLQMLGRPALASSAAGRIDVVVFGIDTAAYHYRMDG